MNLNIKLALDRVSKEYSDDKTFVKLPYELAFIKNNNGEWVKSLEDDIVNDRYNQGALQICEVPKGNYHIRPGAHLSIEDAVYYTALVGEAYEHIHNSTVWARDRYDFSHNLSGHKDKVKWIRDNFAEWKNFRRKSLEKIKQGYNYVVVADISGFYENINIQTLTYDLKQCGVREDIANAISSCLNHWAQNHGKGLPQGYNASHILAKLYLNSTDIRLKDEDYIHYRYVDDIRIFCKSKIEAKQALVTLTALLRDRGLNLQTSKTKILIGEAAIKHIDGVQPIIEEILAEIKKLDDEEKQRIKEQEEIEKRSSDQQTANASIVSSSDIKNLVSDYLDSMQNAASNSYEDEEPADDNEVEVEIVEETAYNNFEAVADNTITIEFEVVSSEVKTINAISVHNDDSTNTISSAVDGNYDSDPETVDISIIKRTFEAFFINNEDLYFDKTLFRFLLKRLSRAKDAFAVDYCKTSFEAHPQETATVLKYFKDIDVVEEVINAIQEFLLSDESIYHYQNYQIIEWLDGINESSLDEKVISLIRKWALDNSKPYYLRAICRKYFCRFASIGDLELFEKICKETTDKIEQSELICFLQKMEKNRRNSTYSRIERKHILNKLAIIYVKTLDAIKV